MRQAPWLWIHDLSSADPYLILPILIIITGLATQRMTPQAGMDPSQQKMMNVMMPVMLGFISFRLAAGLCLVLMRSNLIAIVQQVDHEPHQPGPRNARDRGEAGEEEREEVALSR